MSTVPQDTNKSRSMEIEARARRLNRQFPTGVVVVTTMNEGAPVGLAVNAFTSVSREPPMILVCVNESSKSFPRIFDGQFIGINILASDQVDVANIFAQSGGDKFANIQWRSGSTGVPVLDSTAGHFELEVKYKIPAYTHTIFLGQVLEASPNSMKAPLIYHGGDFFDGAEILQGAGQPTRKRKSKTEIELSNREVLELLLSDDSGVSDHALYAPNYIRHSDQRSYDLVSLKQGLAEMYKGFPDMKRTVKDVLVDGDLASYRWEATGTHLGYYMGVPPTKERVRVSGLVQCRFENGKIAEEWASWSKSAVLHQLGILPLDRD